MHVVTHYRNERHRDYYHRFIKRRGYERIRESPQRLTLSQGSTSTEGDTATRPNKIIKRNGDNTSDNDQACFNNRCHCSGRTSCSGVGDLLQNSPLSCVLTGGTQARQTCTPLQTRSAAQDAGSCLRRAKEQAGPQLLK